MCELYCCTLRRWSTPPGVLGMPAVLRPCACELRCLAVRLMCRPIILHACRTTSPTRAHAYAWRIYIKVWWVALFYHCSTTLLTIPLFIGVFVIPQGFERHFLEIFGKVFALSAHRPACSSARDLRWRSSTALAMLPCRHLRALLHHRPQIYNIPAHLMPNYGTLENSAFIKSFLRYDFAPSVLPTMPICLTSSHFVSFCPACIPAE